MEIIDMKKYGEMFIAKVIEMNSNVVAISIASKIFTFLEIKSEYTIVIVTHNMQQAARVSDRTAFFVTEVSDESDRRTGRLVEFNPTAKIFSNPDDQRTEQYITGRFG